ncbi:myb family transcription factor [Zalerion maritima]|uniref:Myb family transcription factor n=1 Tax=Zalerion maritima TaxID=339359 RepID=A0AAD5RTL3_9PEZI|nr:myb family transcription factor [Zalerion maritima]
MMPKHLRSTSHSARPYAESGMPVSLAASTGGTGAMYNTRLSSMPTTSYYTMPTTTSMAAQQPMQSMSQASYDPYAVQGPAIVSQSVPHRASSGAWSGQDDQTLLAARAQGLNWSQIQATYFPSKTSNACRKRHERLMERKGADDFDARRFQLVAKEYMNMRKEIWQGLAQRTGEKWNVVEAKVMSHGLKNIQSAARAAGRRERVESGQPGLPPPGSSSYVPADDDSGISGIGLTPVDDLDPSSSYRTDDPYRDASGAVGHHGHGESYTRDNSSSYRSSPGAGSHHSSNSGSSSTANATGYSTTAGLGGLGAAPNGMGMGGGMHAAYGGYAHHGYNSSISSTGTNGGYGNPQSQGAPSPYMDPSHGQRLPSVDMGIDAIINRPLGGANGI